MILSRNKLLTWSLLIISILTITFNTVNAEEVLINWDPNSENDLAGYNVYYGETAGTYTLNADVGNQTQYVWANLEEGKTYYFSVTAYDQSGNESAFSDEVSITIDFSDSTPPSILSVSLRAESQLDILFSERLNRETAEEETNYVINNGVQIIGAALDNQNPALVSLVTTNHPLETDFTLVVNNVQDIYSNTVPVNTTFNYRSPDNPDDGTGDDVPPQILNIIVTDLTHLDVSFSEPIDRATAENESNYDMDNGVDVTDADLNASGTIVTLTTTPQTNGTTYRLTVNNISDTSGNPIVGNSSFSYDANVDDGDNNAPEVTSIVAVGPTQINVNFSELVDQESAENEVNYVITPDVEIKGAFLNDNGSTVHLLTETHLKGIDYSISISNIRDMSTTPNIMNANAVFNYLFEKSDIDYDDGTDIEIPNTFKLVGNFPNPFNPETKITFFLEKRRKIELNIYNMLGQLVKTLIKDEMDFGEHDVVWDGTNKENVPVPSGIYVYSLEVKKEVEKGDMLVNVSIERRVKRMTLLK